MTRRLSLAETLKCLKAWRELKDEDALTLLVISNDGLVRFLAQKLLDRGLTFDELTSAGYEGLIRAINKFNYQEGDIKTFSTYISTAIENTMRYEIRRNNKHRYVLSLDQPLEDIKDDSKLTFENIIGSTDQDLVDNVFKSMKDDLIRDALNCLTKKEKEIIILRYGLDNNRVHTQIELAELFGCTRQTIAHHEYKALVKMRHPRNMKKFIDFLD